MMEWTSSFTKNMETSQLRYFIANVKYRTLIWASIWVSIELSRQKIMFNSFTHVIYITFNLSLFIIYLFFFILIFFFHVYNVLNDCIFLEIIEEKLNRTESRRAFLGSGIWPNCSVGFGKVYRDAGLDRIIVWDFWNFNGMRNYSVGFGKL